jgi:hypothetical protein
VIQSNSTRKPMDTRILPSSTTSRQANWAGHNAAIASMAKLYASQGLYVVAVHSAFDGECSCNPRRRGLEQCDTPGKHPCVGAKWPSKATTDPATIEKWLGRQHPQNWGIATGARSGVVVMDVDPRNGGEESFRDLINRLNPQERRRIEQSFSVQTPGGGLHLYLRHPGYSVRNGQGKDSGLPPGIDIKGDDGMVLGPRSVGANGKPYDPIGKFSRDRLADKRGATYFRQSPTTTSRSVGHRRYSEVLRGSQEGLRRLVLVPRRKIPSRNSLKLRLKTGLSRQSRTRSRADSGSDTARSLI